jgi:hypothetical protein
MTKALISFGKVFLICLLVFTLILTGVYAFFEFYFKDNWAKIVKEQIVKNTGLSVEFNNVRFSFLSFIKLNPSLVIEDIKIGEALTVDKFYIEAKLKSLLKRKLLVEALLVESPVFTLIENQKREVSLKGLDFTKLQELLKPSEDDLMREDMNTKEKDLKSISLDLLKIKNANILFEPYTGAPLRFRNLNLDIKDIYISDKPREKLSEIDFHTNFFDKGDSKLSFKGSLETIPLDVSSIPVKGSLVAQINLKDLPKAMLDTSAKLLAFNGSQKHVDLNASLRGDILKTLYGAGTLTLNDFRIGAAERNLLKISSVLNLNTAMSLIKNPNLQFNVSKGSMKIESVDKNKNATGNLNFTLNTSVDLISFAMQVSSTGALSGLKIHEILHAFDPNFKAPIEGIFEIPEYRLSFSGKTPEQQSRSLIANGKFKFTDINIPMILDLKKKKDKYIKFLPIDTTNIDKALEGNFLAASSDFSVSNKLIQMNNLLAESKYATLKGNGSSSFKGFLDFDLNLTLPERFMIAFNVKGESKKPNVKVKDFQLIGTQPLALPKDLGLKINREPVAKAVTQTVDKAINKVNNKLDSIPLTDETKAKAKKSINKLLDLGAKYGVYTKPAQETVSAPASTPVPALTTPVIDTSSSSVVSPVDMSATP